MSSLQPLSKIDPLTHFWVKDLQKSMWDKSTADREDCVSESEGRILSDVEWSRVFDLIKSGQVILTLDDAFGFVLRVTLWSYPLLKDDEIDSLIKISNKHIKDMKAGLSEPSGGFWDLLYPFTHSEINQEAVNLYLPRHKLFPKEKYSYL